MCIKGVNVCQSWQNLKKGQWQSTGTDTSLFLMAHWITCIASESQFFIACNYLFISNTITGGDIIHVIKSASEAKSERNNLSSTSKREIAIKLFKNLVGCFEIWL